MDGTGEQQSTLVEYRLFVSTGRFAFRLRNEGVAPGPEHIAYVQDGTWLRRPYERITEIRLTSWQMQNSRTITQCTISFRDGFRLIVGNTNQWGNGDPARDDTYRAFVADLHARLIASGKHGAIAFRAGMSESRAGLNAVALVGAVILFFVLPVILLLMTGELRALFALVGGVIFLVPAWRTARKNQPRTYSPDNPPDMI